jgi:hypothetical protein
MKTSPVFSELEKILCASIERNVAGRHILTPTGGDGRRARGSLPVYCFHAALMTSLLTLAAMVLAAFAAGTALLARGCHHPRRTGTPSSATT